VEAERLNKVKTMIRKPSNSRIWNPSDSLTQKKKIKTESLNDIGAKRRDQRSTQNKNRICEKCNCKLIRNFEGPKFKVFPKPI